MPLKEILIDLYKIKDPYCGLGQFSINFARELARHPLNDLKVNFLIPRGENLKLENENIRYIQTGFRKRYLPALNKRFELWHSLHQLPSFFPNPRTPQILTIHDLNFLVEKSKTKKERYLRKVQKNVDRAQTITAISNFTEDQIKKHLNLNGKPISVIYNGIPKMNAAAEEKPVFATEQPFLFSISAFSPKKNFEVLLPMMKHLDGHQLILAGNCDTPYGRFIKSEIERLNLKDKILLPGKISNAEKIWLFKYCQAFLFPSLAEGFGLPVIEAMQAGKPIFLSKETALPEIGGKLAFYFENFDDREMAEMVKTNLKMDTNKKRSLARESQAYAEKFSLTKSVNQYVNLYRKLLA